MASKQPTKPDAGHVMISYESKSQEIMKKVVPILKSEGYKVWIDYENKRCTMNDKMVKGIENADVVLIAISKKYQESANCRKEAEYADHKGKPMIPLLVEKGYRADKWLGLVVGKLLYYDLTKEGQFLQKMADVMKTIGDRGKLAGAATNIKGSGSSNDKVEPQTKLQEQVQDIHLSKQKPYDRKDEEIDLIWKSNWLYIQKKPTATSAKPRLSATRWRHFTQDIKPIMVQTIGMYGTNLESCHQDVFSFAARCRKIKLLLLHEITDDSDDDSDIVSGIVSVIPKLTKLEELQVSGFYLGERGQEFFISVASCVAIRVLGIKENNLSESGPSLVSLLSKLPLLSYLELVHTGLSPQEMKQVLQSLPSSCGNMMHLHIGGRAFTSEEFKPVFELKKLKSLIFQANSSDDLIQILKQLPPNIQLLRLRDGVSIHRLTDLISAINRNTRLQFLVVDGGMLDSEDEKLLHSELTKRGCRLLVPENDFQGCIDFQEEINKLKDECFDI